jgi:hypothetical protein
MIPIRFEINCPTMMDNNKAAAIIVQPFPFASNNKLLLLQPHFVVTGCWSTGSRSGENACAVDASNNNSARTTVILLLSLFAAGCSLNSYIHRV